MSFAEKMRNLPSIFKGWKRSRSQSQQQLNNCDVVSFKSFGNEMPTNQNQKSPIKESSLCDDVRFPTNFTKGRAYVQFGDEEERRRAGRPSLATILLCIVLFAIFLVLPIVYLLHCFGLINIDRSLSPHPNYYEIQNKDHYEPSHLVHDQLREDETTTHTAQGIKSNLPFPPPPGKEVCKIVSVEERFDCFPEDGADVDTCEARGCCWSPINDDTDDVPLNIPYCYYPPDYPSFNYVNITTTAFGLTAFLKRNYKSPYSNDVDLIKMTVKFENEDRLRIKFTDPLHNRYEPPIPEVPIVDKSSPTQNYQLDINTTKVGFRIIRKSDNTVIFDSQGIGNMIFSDQFLQLSAKLPSSNIYGIGEQQSNFKLSTHWYRITLFNHDVAPIENTNLYGTHPFYLLVENSGNAHGVFLLNSNAMDVILQPTPAITFRTIGGILDFYFFLGPTPRDVVRQYTDVVGRPFMPPYWGFGFHLCRFGYGSLNNTKKVWKATLDAGIPLDTQWNDLDYMRNRNGFTLNEATFEGLPDFVKELHDMGMHYIPIIDPGVSASEKPGTYPPFDIGMKMDIFVKNASNQVFIGKVWNSETTVWPDFTQPKTVDYWLRMFKSLHDKFAFDGAWIDMNEPSNFLNGAFTGCPQSRYEDPQYLPNVNGGMLRFKTMCMSAKQFGGMHYNVHNLFGFTEGIITNFVMAEIRGKRPMVITRSSFSGMGKYTGHWSGDVFSKWHDLGRSIPQMLNFNLFGIPLIGADICGFNGNSTPALCNRWMQLGAFYPFSRNHNSDDTIAQDPVSMGPLVVKSSRKALKIRYSLLPYLYTLFWNAHVDGDTVARPLFFEFVREKKTLDIDDQFLWGAAIMIVPVLEEGKESVRPYIPKGIWYDYYTRSAIVSEGKRFKLSAPLDTIPILIRGGYVIPQQKGLTTTTASRKTKIELTAAFNSSQQGWGEFYWDDGDSLNSYEERKYSLVEFYLMEGRLKSEPIWWGPENPPHLGLVTVLGVNATVSQVTVNNEVQTFHYDTIHKYLLIDNLDVSLEKTIEINWK